MRSPAFVGEMSSPANPFIINPLCHSLSWFPSLESEVLMRPLPEVPMSLGHFSRLGIVFAIGGMSMTVVPSSSSAQATHRSSQADTSMRQLPDTLPPWGRALSDTRLEVQRDSTAIVPLVEQVKAAIDALSGRSSFPPLLALNEFHRDGGAVVIDLTAANLPRLNFIGAGGTVRILPDGRRIILARHD